MEAVANPITEWPRPLAWFRDFLKGELSPYPGRLATVARMVLAATIVMLIAMTFRIPFGAYAAFHALVISREDPDATIKAVETNVIAFAFSAAFVLAGAMLFAGDPMLRLLWLVAALFTAFFALSAMTNYLAASRFGWLLVIITPLWDEHSTAEAKVERTLWVVGVLLIANIVTVVIELVFTALYPSRDLHQSIARRLTSVEELLACYAQGRLVSENTANELTLLAMLGTSRLRRVLQRSAPTLSYGEQMGAAVALVGRLVDVAATLMHLNPQLSSDAQKRCQAIISTIVSVRTALLAGQVPRAVGSGERDGPAVIPLLGELEKTALHISEAFAGSESLNAYDPSPAGHEPALRLFAPDAFTNPEHIKFAIRGCLAASLCYIIYQALAWPGISTAVTTCFLTALSTIGSSHQKQLLRITGALAGGALGMLAQIFILPSIDSIAGFTLLFLVITCIGAWIISSGPRLSYFGVQLLYAFYLVNLSEFTIQTSLAIARDRVVGILLGLAMMWLVFDRLWGPPAIVGMKKALISLLRSLAKLARDPIVTDLRVAIDQGFALRETINNGFNKVRALGDGVLLEFGPTRQQDLTLRSRILGSQPQLRMLFITRVALFRYRLQLPGFELPEALRRAQQEFDECLARTIEHMADRLEGKEGGATEELEAAFARLTETVRSSGRGVSEEEIGQHVRTFATLSGRISGLALSLTRSVLNDGILCTTR